MTVLAEEVRLVNGSRRSVVAAKIALSVAAILWLAGGLFFYGFVAPTKIDDDGTHWDMIEPVSVERAGELRRDAVTIVVVALAVAALHVALAALLGRRAWSRRLVVAVGSLYCLAALPLAFSAVRDLSSAAPVYAAVAGVLGAILLIGSRPRTIAPFAGAAEK